MLLPGQLFLARAWRTIYDRLPAAKKASFAEFFAMVGVTRFVVFLRSHSMPSLNSRASSRRPAFRRASD